MPLSFKDKISGRTVLDMNGQIVGLADDLLVESNSWQIAAFRVRLKREVAKGIGASSPLLRAAVVDVPAAMVRAVGDAVILSVASSTLHELVPHPEESPGEDAPPDAPPQRH